MKTVTVIALALMLHGAVSAQTAWEWVNPAPNGKSVNDAVYTDFIHYVLAENQKPGKCFMLNNDICRFCKIVCVRTNCSCPLINHFSGSSGKHCFAQIAQTKEEFRNADNR